MRRERRLSFSLSCRLHAKRGIRSRARARAHSAHSDTRPETMAHTSACMASQTIYVHVHVNAVPTDRFRFSFNAVRVFSHFVHRILYLHLRARGGGGGSQSACPQYAYLARRTVRVRCTVRNPPKRFAGPGGPDRRSHTHTHTHTHIHTHTHTHTHSRPHRTTNMHD